LTRDGSNRTTIDGRSESKSWDGMHGDAMGRPDPSYRYLEVESAEPVNRSDVHQRRRFELKRLKEVIHVSGNLSLSQLLHISKNPIPRLQRL
jgi:hypothetical protein